MHCALALVKHDVVTFVDSRSIYVTAAQSPDDHFRVLITGELSGRTYNRPVNIPFIVKHRTATAAAAD